MQLLFISRWFPYPPNNGSKLRIYNLLRGLAACHDVTLLSFADDQVSESDVRTLLSVCREVRVLPWKTYEPQSRRAVLGLLAMTPRSVVDTFSKEMADLIQDRLAAKDYDLIIASQVETAAYRHYFNGALALFEEVELGVFYENFNHASSWQARLRHGLTWLKHRHYLVGLLEEFSACTVASEKERQLLAEAVPDFHAIEVVPNCINLPEYEKNHTVGQPNMLIFTGPFAYSANYEAMVWFLCEVYPRIQAQAPSVRLTITGDHRNLPLPPASNVDLVGFVDDVRSLIARSWISLAPLWTGGGTRLKILEAMALRTPVVATSKGAEGIDAEDGQHLLIADTPEDYASAILRLLDDANLHRSLADNAYQLVKEKYDWQTVLPRFLGLVERAAQTEGHG